MINQYTITSSAWIQITQPGETGVCWLDDDRELNEDRADVRIWHGTTVPGDDDVTKGRRILSPKSNNDFVSFSCQNEDDIFYARCCKSGDSAVLSVDIKGVGTQKIDGDVYIQDQYSYLVDRFLTQKLGTATLASPIALGDRIINLVAGHGFTAPSDMMIEIEEDGYSFQAGIVSVNVNAITVNSPSCAPFTTAAIVNRVNSNLNVNGSVTPVIFSALPPVGVKWDINLMSLNMLDDTDMDDGKFGGIAQITNGVVYRTVDGVSNNIFNSRNNGCFRRHCDLLEYSPKAPAGQYGLHAIRHFNSQQGDGVARRIGASGYGEFQAVIADDLTGITKFFVVIRGHRVV